MYVLIFINYIVLFFLTVFEFFFLYFYIEHGIHFHSFYLEGEEYAYNFASFLSFFFFSKSLASGHPLWECLLYHCVLMTPTLYFCLHGLRVTPHLKETTSKTPIGWEIWFPPLFCFWVGLHYCWEFLLFGFLNLHQVWLRINRCKRCKQPVYAFSICL